MHWTAENGEEDKDPSRSSRRPDPANRHGVYVKKTAAFFQQAAEEKSMPLHRQRCIKVHPHVRHGINTLRRDAGNDNSRQELQPDEHLAELPSTISSSSSGNSNVLQYTQSVQGVLRALDQDRLSHLSDSISDDDHRPPDYESDDESTTYVKQPYNQQESISDEEKQELLRLIESLREEQAELKKKQEIQRKEQEQMQKFIEEHQRKLEALQKKDPKFRIASIMIAQQFAHRKGASERATQSGDVSDTNSQSTDSSEYYVASKDIYVQVEELYKNLHRFRILSRHLARTSSLLTSPTEDLYSEIAGNSGHYDNNFQPPVVPRKRHAGDIMRPGSGSGQAVRKSRSWSELNTIGSSEWSRATCAVPGGPRPHLSEGTPREVTFGWRIGDFESRLQLERQKPGLCNSVTRPFYLYHCGYRCKMVAYLNGHGSATNRALSLLLCVVPGDFDTSLKWPLTISLTAELISQERGFESIKSNPTFQHLQPKYLYEGDQTEVVGMLEFARHKDFMNRTYIKNNAIELRFQIKFIDHKFLKTETVY